MSNKQNSSLMDASQLQKHQNVHKLDSEQASNQDY